MLEPVRNHVCDDRRDLVVPYSCACCTKCWLFVAGNKVGRCPYNGPFNGYVHVGEAQASDISSRRTK
jgi:hypothetical protein